MTGGWAYLGVTPWQDFGKCGSGHQEYWGRKVGAVAYEVSTGIFGAQVGYRHPLGFLIDIPHEIGCSAERGMQVCDEWAAMVGPLRLSERDSVLWRPRSDERARFEDAFRKRGRA